MRTFYEERGTIASADAYDMRYGHVMTGLRKLINLIYVHCALLEEEGAGAWMIGFILFYFIFYFQLSPAKHSDQSTNAQRKSSKVGTSYLIIVPSLDWDAVFVREISGSFPRITLEFTSSLGGVRMRLVRSPRAISVLRRAHLTWCHPQ